MKKVLCILITAIMIIGTGCSANNYSSKSEYEMPETRQNNSIPVLDEYPEDVKLQLNKRNSEKSNEWLLGSSAFNTYTSDYIYDECQTIFTKISNASGMKMAAYYDIFDYDISRPTKYRDHFPNFFFIHNIDGFSEIICIFVDGYAVDMQDKIVRKDMPLKIKIKMQISDYEVMQGLYKRVLQDYPNAKIIEEYDCWTVVNNDAKVPYTIFSVTKVEPKNTTYLPVTYEIEYTMKYE